MRRYDDRPGSAGGYPDERSFGGGGGAQGPAASQGFGGRNYNYYDDDPGYTDTEATSVVGNTADRSDDYYDELGRRGREFGWNAGTDLGLLILRLFLGGVFAVHGAQKLFGVLGGPGPNGFAQGLQQMGFRESATLSLVTGATELGGGALLILGLFTPLAAAGIIGVMGNAILLKAGGPFFNMEGGYEFESTLAAMALGLMFTGPGRAALDNGRAWFRRPLISGFICLLIAVGATAAVYFLLYL